MNLTVHAETYDAAARSIEVSIGNDRRTVRASRIGEGREARIHVSGLAVRFPTGLKVWPAGACHWIEGNHTNGLRAQIDKRGSNNVRLVGFFADFANKPTKSDHNSVRG